MFTPVLLALGMRFYLFSCWVFPPHIPLFAFDTVYLRVVRTVSSKEPKCKVDTFFQSRIGRSWLLVVWRPYLSYVSCHGCILGDRPSHSYRSRLIRCDRDVRLWKTAHNPFQISPSAGLNEWFRRLYGQASSVIIATPEDITQTRLLVILEPHTVL